MSEFKCFEANPIYFEAQCNCQTKSAQEHKHNRSRKVMLALATGVIADAESSVQGAAAL